jgi:hypothetical protein
MKFPPDRGEWPYEAYILLPNGLRSFSAYARRNDDGTVSVAGWGNEGPREEIYPGDAVELKLSVEIRRLRWYKLYAEVYGRKPSQ